MPNRDPAFDDYVLKIHQVLDRLDYYRLLGVKPDARPPQIKKSFYAITTKFHPDRNRDADATVQAAIYDIFKRLNEAYRILCDRDKRSIYDEGLAQGQTRFIMEQRMSMIPKKPEETITSKDARQFYITAKENLDKGNLLQADLHSKMAHSREPNNPAINELIQLVQSAKSK